MHKSKKILALITARGGSKGLPRKNVRTLLGKPLVAWTIEAAKASRYIDRFIVSTDDEDIAGISREYGAEAPFLRPERLAADDSKSIDVIFHAVEWLKNNDGSIYDLIVLLQPTSPLRLSDDIDKAIELLFFKKAQAVVSISEVEHHPYHINTLPEDGCMKNFIRKSVLNKNRQKLPLFYKVNGAIYLAYLDYLKMRKGFFGEGTYAYVMPAGRSVDVDNEIDLKFAEFLLKNKR